MNIRRYDIYCITDNIESEPEIDPSGAGEWVQAADHDAALATERERAERAVQALRELLCEMTMETDALRKYDVYQVTKGAVEDARAFLRTLEQPK